MGIRESLKQTLVEMTATVPTSGVPVKAVGSDLWVSNLTVYPLKGNTGRVYVAFSSAGALAGVAAVELASDVFGSYSLKGELDRNMQQVFNIADLWFDVDTSGDGFYIQYNVAAGN